MRFWDRPVPGVYALPLAVVAVLTIAYGPLIWAKLTVSEPPLDQRDRFLDLALSQYDKRVPGVLETGHPVMLGRADIANIGTSRCEPDHHCHKSRRNVCGSTTTNFTCAYRITTAQGQAGAVLVRVYPSSTYKPHLIGERKEAASLDEKEPYLPDQIDRDEAMSTLCAMGHGC